MEEVTVMFSSDIGPIFLFCPIFPYHDPFPLSLADYIGLPRLFLLSLITPIFNRPLYYLVADVLLLYH